MKIDRRRADLGRIDRPPRAAAIAHAPSDCSPHFLVFVDTEEEFDWTKPLRRDGHSTHHVRAIPAAQAMFEGQGVIPTYLVDYPIVECDEALAILKPTMERGRCAIGTQLHPWVNPPFSEPLTPRNSFTGNLPEPLERAKILTLTDRIEARFGKRPDIYRAGRYGVGPNSAATLEDLGYRLDVSVRARFRYSREGGPDFARFSLAPFWAGPQKRLLALPLSTAYTGLLRAGGRQLYRWAGEIRRTRALLARTGMFARIPLTPEGVPVEDAKEAIRVLAGEGLGFFSLSFHSPSLEPGHTDYVRDAADLKAFYGWWDAVIAQFHQLGIRAMDADGFTGMMWRARNTKA